MKMKKSLVLLISILMLFSVLTGCSKPKVSEEKKDSKTITVKDSRGKDIEINYPAKKIVCLLNSGLNDLYMLEAKDQIVGIDEWTYNNKEIYDVTAQLDDRIKDKSIPAVDKNIEKIISIKPDVVIIWSGNEETIKTLEDKGIKVVGIQVNNFDDVYWKMEVLGKISGKEDRAKQIIDYTKKQLDDVNGKLSKLKKNEKVSSIFVWGPTKLDLAGNKSTGDSILKMSGTKNCAADVNEEHFISSLEKTIKWNPDSIIMWNMKDMQPDDYYKDVQWKDVAAIKNKKVFELPNAFYCDLWTVKYVNAIKFTAKSLYPDLFEELDLKKDKNDMIKFLYNKELR